MQIREPSVAGQFYPANPDQCRADIIAMLEAKPFPTQGAGQVEFQDIKTTLLGGVVPHAGWGCSGSIAARVFRVLHEHRTPEVMVLFGGVHRYRGKEAAAFGSGRWSTPLGTVEVDQRLVERILGHTNLIVDDPYAHEGEHSLEVQMPFVRYLFPDVKVVPIMVPVGTSALDVGDAVGRTLKAYQYDALIVGTTDLTHYGPRYGFTPHGEGAEANRWAKNENDTRFLDLLCRMRADELVAEARKRRNACNSGAAVATIKAVQVLGAQRGVLLEHATSAETARVDEFTEPSDSVGYAGLVFI